MRDSARANRLEWRPVTYDPAVMSLWQVLFKDHRGDAREYFGQVYYCASTERMPCRWHDEHNIEDLLEKVGCPNIEACFWGTLSVSRPRRLFIFAPQAVLEAWEWRC